MIRLRHGVPLILICLFGIYPILGAIRTIDSSLDFVVNNQIAARLNSTGLAIGGSLSSANLDVQGELIVQKMCVGSGDLGGANLQINGSFGILPKIINAGYAHTLSDASIYFVDTASIGDNVRLTLPPAETVLGRDITVKKSSPEHRVTITAASNIDLQTTIVLSTANRMLPFARMISDGHRWLLLDHEDGTLETNKPTGIANLILWLDANDQKSIDLDSSDNLLIWRDKSGKSNHFSGTDSNRCPSYMTESIHGMPSFSTSQHQLLADTGLGIGSNEDRTIFIVCLPKSKNGDSELFSVDSGKKIDFGSGAQSHYLRLRNTETGVDVYSSSGTVTLNQPHLITVSARLGSTIAYNGSQEIINTSSNAFHYDLSGTVRLFGSNISGREFNGSCGEVILFSRELSLQEKNAMWQYLSKKWGIHL